MLGRNRHFSKRYIASNIAPQPSPRAVCHNACPPRAALVLAICVGALLAAGCGGNAPAPQAGQPLVSAAADLAYAFPELGRMFEEETGVRVTFNFGSTGQLARQIESGAPVDLFAAANVAFVDDLVPKGLIIPDTRQLYARGFIVLWSRADSTPVIERLQDLVNPGLRRVAIANPDHAPYGAAAREALRTAGVWERVQPKLVLGENARQTLQYAETGNVDVAIVALSLAVVAQNGRWTLIPPELHGPIDQGLAVVKGAKHEKEARAFAGFINGPKGRPVMRRYGFALPEETPRQ